VRRESAIFCAGAIGNPISVWPVAKHIGNRGYTLPAGAENVPDLGSVAASRPKADGRHFVIFQYISATYNKNGRPVPWPPVFFGPRKFGAVFKFNRVSGSTKPISSARPRRPSPDRARRNRARTQQQGSGR
jgi:hypothetical protein